MIKRLIMYIAYMRSSLKQEAGKYNPSVAIRGITMLIITAFIFSSCNKTEDFIIDYHYDYFPLEIGHYVIYDVDSIVFNGFNDDSDTFYYQKKHVIDSTFEDNSGREAYKIIRYQRSNAAQPWFLTDVWYALRTQSALEVGEENQRFVKLLFPPEEGQTWQGNEYLTIVDENEWLKDWEYEVTSINTSEMINGMGLDTVLTVLQQDYEDIIKKFYGEEKYAKGVGLVYKQLLKLEKQNTTAPWTEPENGFILTMTISDYGPR